MTGAEPQPDGSFFVQRIGSPSGRGCLDRPVMRGGVSWKLRQYLHSSLRGGRNVFSSENFGRAYKKIIRRDGSRIEVNGPIHEGLAAADGKYHRVHVVDRDGFDHHSFST